MKSLAFLVFLYLVMPGSGQLVWDGLPLSTRAEVAALVLITVVFLSGEFRHSLTALIARHSLSGLVKPLLVVLCTLKLLSFAWAPLANGFASCYRSIYYPLQDRGACEKSYEAPFTHGMGAPFTNVSRIDNVIDFGESAYDWSLPFINDFPRLGKLWLERVPFSARYSTNLHSSGNDQVLPVFAIGEISININGVEVVSHNNYSRHFLAFARLPPGKSALSLQYQFRDDELAIPPEKEPTPRGPYAQLKVGEPIASTQLTKSARVYVTGASNEPVPEPIGSLQLRDRYGKPIEFVDIASEGFEPSELTEPEKLFDIEIPVAALENAPIGIADHQGNELAVISKQYGDPLRPVVRQSHPASLRLELTTGLTLNRESLQPLSPGAINTLGRGAKPLLYLLDAMSFFVVAGLMSMTIFKLGKTIGVAIGLAAFAWLVVGPLDNLIPAFAGGGRELVIPFLLIAVIAVRARKHIAKYPLAVGMPVATVLATHKVFEHLRFNHPGHETRWWGTLLFFWRDSDWFVARGNARMIFTTGSLKGGEVGVFFSQAASRYLAYFANMLLGEQDVLIGLISVATGFLVILFLTARIAIAPQIPQRELVATVVGFLGLIFLGDQLITAFAFLVSSEYPTWLGLLGFTIYILDDTAERRVWPMFVGGGGLALLVLFRPNFILVSLCLFSILALEKSNRRDSRIFRQQVAWASAAFLAVIPLSLLHNLYYGNMFVPFQGNASINRLFEWNHLLSGGFISASDLLWRQLRGLLHWVHPGDPSYAIAFWGWQGIFTVAILIGLRQKVKRVHLAIACGLPISYVFPMLSFDQSSYFPRHIVTASLLCLVSGLLILSRKREPSTRSV